MNTDDGRVGKPTGLSQVEPQEGLDPPGFDPSRVFAAAYSERVILACAAAKAVPGDVWGQGAEGHYAFLCGLAAMFNLPGDVQEMIEEERERSAWWAREHPEHPMTKSCPARIPPALGFPRRDSDGSPKGRDAGRGSIAEGDDSAGRETASPKGSRHAP